MSRATHVVRSRLFHAGKWREPGTPIDASWWPTRLELEQSGDLVALPPEKQVEISDTVVKRSGGPAPDPSAASAPAGRLSPPVSSRPASSPPRPPAPVGKAKRGKRP